MSTRIAVKSLYAENVSIAVLYYRDLLGLTLLPHPGGRPHYDLGGSYLALLKGQPAPTPNQPNDV